MRESSRRISKHFVIGRRFVVAHLQTGLVPHVVGFHLPLQVVPRVHHLVRHGVLLVPAVAELVRAQQDPVVDAEAPALLTRAHPTQDILLVQITSQLIHFVGQEPYDGAVLQEITLVGLAALADGVRFRGVQLGEVVALELDVAVAGHAAQHDGEGAAPGVVDRVEFLGRWAGRRDGGGVGAVGGLLGLRHGGRRV